MDTKKYLSLSGLTEYDALIKERLDDGLSTKKDKDLIVTYQEGSTFRVTHTSQEVYEAINNGQTVKFQKDTELLNVLEATSSYITFYMFYVSMEGKLQQKIVVVNGNSIMLDQVNEYDYATTDQLINKADKTELNNYYTKTETDNLELINTDDIDAICGGAITYAEEVMF